jgi:hypothetical protein
LGKILGVACAAIILLSVVSVVAASPAVLVSSDYSPKKPEALRLLDDAVRFVTRGQEKVTDISRHVRPYTPDY